MKRRKAVMAIGSILMTCAALVLAVICATVLFQTSGSLREQSLKTGDQAENEINAQVITTTIALTDGSDMELEFFEHDMKLGPGSNELQFDQLLITILTYDSTGSLTFRGMNGTTTNDAADGFYTLTSELLGNVTGLANSSLAEDYDLDGVTDNVSLNADGQLVFSFSKGGSLVVTDFNCTGASHSITGTYSFVGHNEIRSIHVNGECGNDYTGTATITVTPTRIGEGFFTIQYLRRGNNPIDGNMQLGDIVRVYYESPRTIGPDEPLRVNLVPKTGTPQLVLMQTPQIITERRTYVYPP